MRIRQIELVVAPAHLASFPGRFLKPDRVTNLVISSGEGTLRVSCDYKLVFFPVPGT